MKTKMNTILRSPGKIEMAALMAALCLALPISAQQPNEPGPGPDQQPPPQRSGGGGGIGVRGGGGGGVGRGTPRGPFTDRLQSIIRRAPGSGAKALVIRTSDSSPKEQSDLEEDLTVMSHILDKAVDESGSRRVATQTAMGIDLYFAPGANSIRSLFLDGYGALFMV